MDKKRIRLFLLAISAVLCIIAFALFATPFISIKLMNGAEDITGFQLAFDEEGEYVLNSDASFAFLFSLALTFGACVASVLAACVMVLQETGKLKPKKQVDPQKQKNTLMVSLLMSIVTSTVPLVLNLLSVKIAGYADNPLANLGSGAVASAILLLLGEIIAVGTNLLLPVELRSEETTEVASTEDKTE